MAVHNDTKTRLLTLLNVSHLRVSKRKLVSPHSVENIEPPEKRVKLNKPRTSVIPEQDHTLNDSPFALDSNVSESSDDAGDIDNRDDGSDEENDTRDPFSRHFGTAPKVLNAGSRKKVDGALWTTAISKSYFGGSKTVNLDVGEGTNIPGPQSVASMFTPKLVPVNKKESKSTPSDLRQLRSSLLEHTLQAKDLYLPHVRLDEHSTVRNAVSLVLLNHILKIRRKVLKNNDRLTSAASKSEEPPEDIQDQGFTRPSTLVLVPFRNSALAFLQSFLDHFTASISQSEGTKKTQEAQVHYYSRFISQYSLPEGAVDKLATAEPGIYPPDHVQTFSGNIDDNFKIGVKVTKRSVRLFEAFYGADLIVASPLGLRLAIEKEGNADFLSSIEVVVADQLDAMLMQNWDHVQFVFSHMNKIPKDSHGADFSRIKPWYLDEHSAYLRQTILLSQYDSPEIRSLFNSLKNVEGKTRSLTKWESTQVPDGIDQKYIKFEPTSPRDEAEKRFEYFTKKIFPATLRSAVQSSGTVIFVPSYFDFIRVRNWMNKNKHNCAFLSEDSSNQDISRARLAFFNGAKPFLVVTERFYFFRRYRLRGVRNVIFYAPPEHAQFYAEFLTFPFLDEGVDASDITVKVLYSKYDFMRLERVVGTDEVGALME